MPSACIEFVTQMGSHTPEYVNPGLEMQTNVFHDSGLHAKITRVVMKYNRRRHVITADIQIPDYNVKAGVRLGVVDENTKGRGTHSISLDFINKNVSQCALVDRAK